MQIVVEDVLEDNAVELCASYTSDTLYVADVNLTGAAGARETRIASVINGIMTPLVVDDVSLGDYTRGQVQGKVDQFD